MMGAVFATMLFALVCGWLGRERPAIVALFVCLGLSIGLFLWEIYSPEYGFRMPWIQTSVDGPDAAA